jgi:hypothetical protein
MFIYFIATWNILWRFGILYDHLVHFSGVGIMYQEKSGNPGSEWRGPTILMARRNWQIYCLTLQLAEGGVPAARCGRAWQNCFPSIETDSTFGPTGFSAEKTSKHHAAEKLSDFISLKATPLCIPWPDSISRPIAPVWSMEGGDDDKWTIPPWQVKRPFQNLFYFPRRCGIVVIATAYRTEDPGFESRQVVRFLGFYTLQCCCHNLVCIVIVCTWEK